MKSIDTWLQEYGESHKNATNKVIHWVCVPLIFFSVIALLAAIPTPSLKNYFGPEWARYMHYGTLVLALGLLFYLRLSIPMFLGITLFGVACLRGIIYLEMLNFPLWGSSLIIFAAAWIGQFIGHSIEGKKPSFLKDIQFLLIGPAWLMAFIFKRVGIKY
jgi:uncharacterized membrane protein YGL010W